MTRKPAHFRRQLELRYILEIGVGVAHLVGIAKRYPQQALAEGFEHHDAFAAAQNDAAEPDHSAIADRIADDCKGFLSHLIRRSDIIGTVDVSIVDFGARHEAVD